MTAHMGLEQVEPYFTTRLRYPQSQEADVAKARRDLATIDKPKGGAPPREPSVSKMTGRPKLDIHPHFSSLRPWGRMGMV
jgi:hypothetical protein